MPFDSNQVLFTDADPRYRNTKIESGIPPPSLDALPRVVKNSRDGAYGAGQRGRGQQRYPSNRPYPNQMHMNQPHMNQMHPAQMQPFQARPIQALPIQAQSYHSSDVRRNHVDQIQPIDLSARLQHILVNKRGPLFVDQLSTPDWSRMMSDRDDVRGRQSDSRLCTIQLLQQIHEAKGKLSTVPFDRVEAAGRALNPYAGVLLCALGNGASVALGHLDFLVQPVREYVRPDRVLRFVDLGSQERGFSEYIRWRVGQTSGARAQGWYFAPAPADSESNDLKDLSLFATPGGILDPHSIDQFVLKVRDECSDGVDLVVAECCPKHSDLSTDLEKQQYAYTIAQATVALRVLQQGGTFVFKMYEATTPLSAELLFLIHSCFERVAIVRSFVSRPTSSERFVVCNRLVADPRWVAAHLLAALTKMHAGQLKPSHLVSWTRVTAEREFMEPVYRSNVAIAQMQVQALNAMLARPSQPAIALSKHQIDSANACLQHWSLPPTKPMT
ncbi:hypothetical protein IW148_004873 [Coemansia sp. RSA 1199]|nr:hypothetical protein IW148_004873 [Coemansia sp. RSA 1199]